MVLNNKWLSKISSKFLSQNEFDKLERASVRLTFKKGETILKQGSPPTHIIYLEQGLVKFNFDTDEKKELILTIVSAPKILGGANLFYKDNNLFSIIAVEECEVILIDSGVLLEILSNNARFSILLFEIASEMFKKSILNFISLASKQKEGRIADIFLYLSENVYNSNSFHCSLTRKEIAEFAICSPENVIMTLSRWQNEGIITLSGKNITIEKIDKLKQISKVG